MTRFKVVVEGRNFLIATPEGEAKHGFYTNRFVEASNPDAAETAAVEQLRGRQALRDVARNRWDDPPVLYVAEIKEMASFEGLPTLDQGLIWFPENASSDGDPAERK